MKDSWPLAFLFFKPFHEWHFFLSFSHFFFFLWFLGGYSTALDLHIICYNIPKTAYILLVVLMVLFLHIFSCLLINFSASSVFHYWMLLLFIKFMHMDACDSLCLVWMHVIFVDVISPLFWSPFLVTFCVIETHSFQ